MPLFDRTAGNPNSFGYMEFGREGDTPGFSVDTDGNARFLGGVYVGTDPWVINVRDPAYGAVGNGVTDDRAAIQAAIDVAREAGTPVSGDQYLGVPVYFPAGRYLVNGPLKLPRSGVSIGNSVSLVGQDMWSTEIVAGSGFPSNSGVIEWDDVGTRVYGQTIRDIGIIPKNEIGSYCIYYKFQGGTRDYTELNNQTLYNCRFENLLLHASNQYHDAAIRFEGRADFSMFRNLVAHFVRNTMAYSSALLKFDDFTQWPALAGLTTYGIVSDYPGANCCSFKGIFGTNRGGYITALYGRVNASSVQDVMTGNGGWDQNPHIYLRDSGNTTLTNLTLEGFGEYGILTFENCRGITAADMFMGVTDTATAPKPGAGIRLINSKRCEIRNRQTEAGVPPFSATNSFFVIVDANSTGNRFINLTGNGSFETEWSIASGATDNVIDYRDVTGGGRTVWSPPDLTVYQAQSGYYMTPSGSKTTLIMSADSEWAVPIRIGKDCTLDRIGVEVTVIGAVGSLIRLGIRASTAGGLPGALLVDAGTVAGDALGVAEKTISTRIQKPGVYWLTATAQNSGGTPPTIRCMTGNTGVSGATTLAAAMSSTTNSGWAASSVTGALPATYTVAFSIGVAPLLTARAV